MPPTDREPGIPARDDSDDRWLDGESDLPARSRPGGVPAGSGDDEPVTQEQLERVIRRASDLQFKSSTTLPTTLDVGEVIRIGEEVGLEPRYVQQAMAEVQAESLIPSAPEDGGFMAKWAGPSYVRVSRVVPGNQADVERNLEHYLREKELLHPVRSQRGRSLWQPAGGVVSSMRRAMDVGGHGYALAKAKRIQVAVEPLERGWSLVTLTADMSNLRGETAGGWMFGMGMASIGPSVAMIAITGGAALAIVGAVGLVGAAIPTARFAARRHLAKERERLELNMLGLLDRLERGETLEPQGEAWHQKLLRSAGIEMD